MQSVRKWSITRVAFLFSVYFGVFFIGSLHAQDQSGKIDRSAPATVVAEKVEEKPQDLPAKKADKAAAAKSGSQKPESQKSESPKSAKQPSTDQSVATDSAKPNAPAKHLDSAIINLQTTVTGNQEQPRVMYILPWQSPAPEDVDFESLENQTKSVFGHIERDELRRELESLEKKTK